MCGEQHWVMVHQLPCAGSSPRVRGTVPLPSPKLTRRRIIPACAGNSSTPRSTARTMPDHPRVCGEQIMSSSFSTLSAGSSPRVRGTGSRRVLARRSGRIIPACAGNSPTSTTSSTTSPDHPRVCGEQIAMDINWMHFTGSSPRVRGTVSRLHRWLIGRRIIPACAGNSGTGHERASPDPDHPRVCGEQHGPCMRLTVRAGSSPRVRGTAIKALHHRMPSRIIPACAGNRDHPKNA